MDTADFKANEFLCKCGCGLGVRDALILALQAARTAWGHPMAVDCGARCRLHNAAVGGAADSAHVVGLAADIADPAGLLKAWIAPRLAKFGLWMEAPHASPGWAHLQVRPASHRVFEPFAFRGKP